MVFLFHCCHRCSFCFFSQPYFFCWMAVMVKWDCKFQPRNNLPRHYHSRVVLKVLLVAHSSGACPAGMTLTYSGISGKRAPLFHAYLRSLPEDFTIKETETILVNRQPPSWQGSLIIGPINGRVTLPSECWQRPAGHQHSDQPYDAKHSASRPSTTEEMHRLAGGPHSTACLAFKVLHHWKI